VNKKSATQILMVNNDATFEQIKYNYRKLALEFHPDKNNSKNTNEKFKMITIAYHFLKNQNKLRNFKNRSKRTPTDSKSHQKPPYSEKNNHRYNTEENWSRFTKDFEMDENFWRQYEKSFWEDYEVKTRKNSDKKNFENPFWDVKQKDVNPEPKNYQNNQSKAFNHNLSVDVDESLCIGCCSCETIAPKVFAIDKLKMINPKSHVHNQYGASYEKIMDAAETCPTKAIQVEERKSGKKIFPR
jgi:curved DNA-binding protein CbpA